MYMEEQTRLSMVPEKNTFRLGAGMLSLGSKVKEKEDLG